MNAAIARNKNELDSVLGHRFKDAALLNEALRHPSVAGKQSYQRLEFLGDRVLGTVIAEALLRAFPEATEGDLAVRLNELVRRETLAAVAEGIGLAPYVSMSAGEERTGGREKPAILADICESLIGALYLDGGLEPAKAFVMRHWEERLQTASSAGKDAKTQLQEWAQARGLQPPTYSEIACDGPPHDPEFTVEVSFDTARRCQAKGGSKRAAEQRAARLLLDQVGDEA